MRPPFFDSEDRFPDQMITSRDNSKLKLARKLAERRWREKEGAVVTEGEDLLAAGIAAGADPIAVLVAAESGIEGEPVEPDLLEAASSLGSGTRAIAIWPMPDGAAPSAEGLCIYLHGVGDPGNIGTIIRTADGLGASALVLGPGCADPYGPKAVRATMGSIFAIRPHSGSIADCPQPRLALVPSGGSEIAPAAEALAGGGTVCLGGEREGLSDHVLAHCELAATIALRSGFDSLNVAAAAAIALERIHSAAVEGGSAEGAVNG